MQHGRVVIDDVNLRDPIPWMIVAEPCRGIFAHPPGEIEVLRRHRHAIAPFEIGLELERHRHSAAGRRVFELCQTVLHRRQFSAQQAGVLPILVERRDLAHREIDDVGLDDLGIDVRMHARRELGDTDDEIVFRGCGLAQGGQRKNAEGGDGGADLHGRIPVSGVGCRRGRPMKGVPPAPVNAIG